MKKTITILSLVVLAFLACQRTPKNAPAAFSVENYVMEDSVQFPEEALDPWMSDDMAYYLGVVDIPVTENEELRDNIINWISSNLNENYQGDSQDVKAMIEFDKNDFLSLDNGTPQSRQQVFITMDENNDRYVTYSQESYLYSGGAHGITLLSGASFNKISGQRFTFGMFVEPQSLTDLIQESLKTQYFDELMDGADVTFDEVIFSESVEEFPLPVTEPWIRSDSVIFVYQSYEIAPYALGIPQCGIPYQEIKGFLTEEGVSFFEIVKKK